MITKEFLEEEYLQKGKTFRTIAKELNCSKDKLQYWAEKHGIKTRSSNRKRCNVIIGKKYGSLLVLKCLGNNGHSVMYDCVCDCGNEISRDGFQLFTKKQNMCWDCRNTFISKIKWKGYGEISGEFWDRVKRSAKDRQLKIEISIEDAWKLFLKQNKKCALSGVDLMFDRKEISNTTASLDRIDSSKNYTLDNIQWLHKQINISKMNLSDTDYINWCSLVVENAKLKA